MQHNIQVEKCTFILPEKKIQCVNLNSNKQLIRVFISHLDYLL